MYESTNNNKNVYSIKKIEEKEQENQQTAMGKWSKARVREREKSAVSLIEKTCCINDFPYIMYNIFMNLIILR